MSIVALNSRVIVKVGDITKEKTDAIVNAANWTLMGGGGVDGAIHRSGGKQILKACQEIRKTIYPEGLPTGQAVITPAGKLKAKFVIHTVGPVFGQENGKEPKLLSNSYSSSLVLASDNKLKTIAFPSISTGAFHYPKHEAAKVVSNTLKKFLQKDTVIEKIHLVFISEPDAKKFIKHQAL